MVARGATELAKWSQHTRALPPLRIGDRVRPPPPPPPPRRWDKTGIVTEVKQYDQYWIHQGIWLRTSDTTESQIPTQVRFPTTDTQPPLVPPPNLRPSPTEPDTDPTLWDSLPRELHRHCVRSLWIRSLINRLNLPPLFPPLQTDPPHPPCGDQHGNA